MDDLWKLTSCPGRLHESPIMFLKFLHVVVVALQKSSCHQRREDKEYLQSLNPYLDFAGIISNKDFHA